MTSEPIRDPVTDPLLTPLNAALLVIDYQPSQLAAVTSMDHELLIRNIVSVAKLAKTYDLPIVLSTVNVVANGNRRLCLPSRRSSRRTRSSIARKSTPGRTWSSAGRSRQRAERS
jgi:nicotinamidase-related amidase